MNQCKRFKKYVVLVSCRRTKNYLGWLSTERKQTKKVFALPHPSFPKRQTRRVADAEVFTIGGCRCHQNAKVYLLVIAQLLDYNFFKEFLNLVKIVP